MTSEQRAQTIRARMRADMVKSLREHGVRGVSVDILRALVDDGMHHVEHLLAEIEGMNMRMIDPTPLAGTDEFGRSGGMAGL